MRGGREELYTRSHSENFSIWSSTTKGRFWGDGGVDRTLVCTRPGRLETGVESAEKGPGGGRGDRKNLVQTLSGRDPGTVTDKDDGPYGKGNRNMERLV